MGVWTAEFSNDPENDFNLYVELLEDDEYKARIYYDTNEIVCIRFYGGSEAILSFDWLSGIIKELSSTYSKKTQPSSDGQ